MNARYCLFLLLGLVACETPLDLDLSEDYAPALVVHSFFNPDSVWTVRMSRSIRVDEPALASELFVEDAAVFITGAAGKREELIHVNGGVYRSAAGNRPSAGSKFAFEANHPNLGTIRAASQAPMLQTDFLSAAREDSEGPDRVRIRTTFSVTDVPGKSYFYLRLYQVVPGCRDDEGHTHIFDDPRGVPIYRGHQFDTNNPSFYHLAAELDEPHDALNWSDSPFFSAFFSDRLFEDSERVFEIMIEPETFDTPIEPRFRLVISALSADLIRYERTTELQDEYLWTWDPVFFNPIDVHSNVDGGLGIFAGYTNNSYRFDADGNSWEEEDVGIGRDRLPICPGGF